MLRMAAEVFQSLFSTSNSWNPPIQILTEDVFTTGLSSYLVAFAYNSTTEDNLFFYLEVTFSKAETISRRRRWLLVPGHNQEVLKAVSGRVSSCGLISRECRL